MNKTALFEYGVSSVFAAAVVGSLYYLEVRLSGEAGLGALSVSLAAGTLFLLGYVLLLGPMTRMFDFMDKQFRFRKEIGIMAFFTGLTHVYLAMFPLARNGPWGLYRARPFSAYPGIEALGVLFILFVISYGPFVRLLGSRLWWKVQYWGVRLAFVLIAVHMIVLKYGVIAAWIATGGNAQLIIWETLFTAFVVYIRLTELAGKRRGRLLAEVGFTLFAVAAAFIAVRPVLVL